MPANKKLLVLPGDGIGPEVTAEGVRALQAVAQRFGHTFDLHEAPMGGAAIDATGTPLPDDTLELARSADAVLLGAIGGPKWSDPGAKVRPEQGLLKIRRELGLFANLRPVATMPELAAASPLKSEKLAGVDILVIRELTGGIYFGKRSRSADSAFDTCEYTAAEIERVCRVAGKLALARRRKVASVDGFQYSEALKHTAWTNWDDEHFLQWVENNKKLVPGTKMIFPAGVKDETDRANLLAYIKSQCAK